ncbi:hypothetical protein ACQP3F_29680, partial [Escherichia coli]
EKLLAENFPEFVKGFSSQIRNPQECQSKSRPHNQIRLKTKGKILKAVKEKLHITFKSTYHLLKRKRRQ